MKGFNSNMAEDYHTSQSNLMAADPQQQLQQQQHSQRAAAAATQQELYSSGSGRQSAGIVDEMQQDLTYLSREAPLDGGESTFGAATSYSQLGLATGSQRGDSVLHMGTSQDQLSSSSAHNMSQPRTNQEDDLLADWQSRQDGAGSPTGTSYNYNEQALNQLSPDNVDIQRPLQQAGQFQEQQSSTDSAAENHQQPEAATVDSAFSHLKTLKPFLVSFMVDARGGAMRGCRHSGVRVIIPPNSAQMPMRITCRYLRRERLIHPPPLMEGEACASKIMEVGPAGAKFLTPVLIEVPHFASLRGKEREIIILRSDSGEVWREHLFETDQKMVDSIIRSAGEDQLSDQKENSTTAGDGGGGGEGDKKRLTRIVTNEFPQYFAIISRVRQEVHPVGPDGSTVDSQVVDRVQAIFTEGALTKRIKIGLQKQHEQHPQAAEHTAEQSAATGAATSADEERSGSPAAGSQHQQQDRAVSPQSGGSATAKRRSRFLACFGAGHGSIDPLNGDATDGNSGGESPRQACKEKPCKKRFILGDVSDSDGESAKSSPDSPTSLSRKRRHLAPQEQLVPEDYYIEKEPPLILNIEPKTYGKRMASSSAQTDSKLNGSNGFIMTTSAKKPKKKRRGLLGRRKHKTQMNICCEPMPARSKSVEPVVDSSLESTATNEQQRQQQDLPDSASMIHDVVTSDDLKWRTCTIQTDSDSVTVNYVTLNAVDDESAAAAAIAEATVTATSGGGDDGYVSGSGDLKKESSFGKGLFNLSFGSSSAPADDSKRAARKKSKERKEKPSSKKEATSDEEEKVSSTEGDDEQQQPAQNESLRSASPTSKELKLKLKQERQEKQKREKEEKRLQKEAEEAAAKAEKLKRKQEKEAKKAEKLAQKSVKKSPSASPVPQEVAALPAAATKSTSQVKFAADLVSSDNHEPVKQLDSIQNVIDSTQASYEQHKERLSQEDGRDMVEMSISDSNKLTAADPSHQASIGNGDDIPVQQPDDPSIVSRTLEVHHSIAKTLQDGTDELERAEENLISLSSTDDQPPNLSSVETEQPQQQKLKPILKQQSTAEEIAAELTIGDERSVASRLVSEATEEAVRAADKLKSAESSSEADRSGLESPISSSSASKKEEKERLKRETKEEKQRLKEAKKLAKEAEAEVKRAAKEAKLEAERVAKEAKAEQDRLAKEAKLEKERLAKEAKAEKERLAKEAKETKKAVAAVVALEVPSSPPEDVIEQQQVEEQQQQQLAEVAVVQQDVKSGDESTAEDSVATKETKRRFKIKLPKFSIGSKQQTSSPQKEAENEVSEPSALADDSTTDNSAAIAAAATQVVEEAVAEAERLAAEELTSADETITEEAPKISAVAEIEKPAGDIENPAEEKGVDDAVSENEDAKRSKKQKKSSKLGGKFKLSFPKFGSSGSPTKPETIDDPTKEAKPEPEPEEKTRSRSGSQGSSEISDSEAKLDEAVQALKKATLEAKQEYERLAEEAENDELTAEVKEAKLKLVQEAKERAANAEEASKEAKRKFKLGFKVRLPKFGSSSPSSPEGTSAAASKTLDSSESKPEDQKETKEEESLVATQKATDVSVESTIEASDVQQQQQTSVGADDTTTTDSSSLKKKEKKAKKPKKTSKKTSPTLAAAAGQADNQDSSESAANTASKSSFFSRLFSKSKKPTVPESSTDAPDSEPANVEQSVDIVASQQQQKKQSDEPLIVSEMYPSDPDDEDGEMILEVNVPHDLVHKHKQSDMSQASDTLATTIDETLATSTVHQSYSKPSKDGLASMSSPTISIEQHHEKEGEEDASKPQQPQISMDQDDQATLVNFSQMITSDSINHDADDDDATENLVSQANDLVQETSAPVVAVPEQTLSHLQGADIAGAAEQQPAETPTLAQSETKKSKPSKEELKAEKARKELEVKLEKEAKKQAKEDEKLKKKQAKEEKLKAEMAEKMAKKQEKEEAERKKCEAKEAKRLEKLAKKDKKKAEKGDKKKKDEVAAPVEEIAEAAAASGLSETVASAPTIQDDDVLAEPKPVEHEGSVILSETPINTETEVERIVEEVVGEDGILTKTTKLIETKYVTTRREELRTSEHREIPLEEYERMKLGNLTNSNQEESASRRLSLSSSSSFASSGNHEDEIGAPTTQVKQRPVEAAIPAYEHKELDEIRSAPSFFGPELPEGISEDMSEKKALKKRVRLNNKLIKRAYKLAKSESKKAKKSARAAESEIAVCDEAAKQARKELKRAIKQAKKARKVAEKAHKKMDKVDKKLAKREKKIQKKQRKLDKRSAKLAKKEAKQRAKQEAKEAKKLRRSSSGSQGGSKKSIKLEDIGDPVLKSSSRLSIGETVATSSQQQQQEQLGYPKQQQQQQEQEQKVVAIERDSPASEELQVVEMSLDDNERQHAKSAAAAAAADAAPEPSAESEDNELVVHHTITTTTVTEHPDGQISEQTSHQVLTGQEAAEAARKLDEELGEDNQSEEIDVVNDLPDIQNSHSQNQKRLAEAVEEQ